MITDIYICISSYSKLATSGNPEKNDDIINGQRNNTSLSVDTYNFRTKVDIIS